MKDTRWFRIRLWMANKMLQCMTYLTDPEYYKKWYGRK